MEGLNLAKTSAIYFSEPGITGRILRVKELPDGSDIRLGSNGTPSTIDLGPLPPRNQVTVEVEVAPEAEIGPVSFRLLTPLGTSPEGRFLVEPYYGEAPDKEPNDTPETAFETFLRQSWRGHHLQPRDVTHGIRVTRPAGGFPEWRDADRVQPATVVAIFDADLNLAWTAGRAVYVRAPASPAVSQDPVVIIVNSGARCEISTALLPASSRC